MPWAMFDILLGLPTFALVLFRLSGLVLTAPVLGSPLIPVRVKVAFVFVAAALVFPMVRGQVPSDLSLPRALVGCVGELTIGAVIGLSLAILLSGAEVTGLTIGQQAGLALGEVFNPTYNDQTSVLGQLYSIVFVLVFLSVGGHREMVAALLDTFRVTPLLAGGFSESYVLLLVETLGAAFVLAIRLAGPVLIALLLTSILLGIVSRVMPQLHVLNVGFTFKVMIALGGASIALTGGREILVQAVAEGVDRVRGALGVGG